MEEAAGTVQGMGEFLLGAGTAFVGFVLAFALEWVRRRWRIAEAKQAAAESRERDREQWLRDERLKRFGAVLDAGDELSATLDAKDVGGHLKAVDQLMAALRRVNLLSDERDSDTSLRASTEAILAKVMMKSVHATGGHTADEIFAVAKSHHDLLWVALRDLTTEARVALGVDASDR